MEDPHPARLTASEGRRFALVVGAAFGVLGAIAWWREHSAVAWALATISALLLIAGIVAPGKLGPVFRAWMGLALLLSKVTTPIVLGIVYFLVITPVGLVMRLFGHRPLRRVLANDSYWIPRANDEQRSDLKRQF